MPMLTVTGAMRTLRIKRPFRISTEVGCVHAHDIRTDEITATGGAKVFCDCEEAAAVVEVVVRHAGKVSDVCQLAAPRLATLEL